MEKEPVLNLRMNMAEFEGVFANLFTVATFGQEARLDCVYVDRTSEDPETGETAAKVVARVNMTTQALVELRDMLDEHVAGHLAEVPADAE